MLRQAAPSAVAPRPGRAWPPLLLVVLAHALLLLAWLQAGRYTAAVQADTADAPQPAPVWLWWPRPAVAERAQPPHEPQSMPRVPAPAPRDATRQPQAITLPATEAPAAQPSGAAAVAAPMASTSPASAPPGPALAAPLDLSLPRQPQAAWRARNPALDDPRSNTRLPAGVEARIAAALGDDTWQVERLDLDTVRFRSGSRCLLATRSRAGQLELAGGAFRETWGVRDC
jgi:hypothetical protein